ncbi:MAG: universal stress protein, partial [Candidatus Tectimicrobiota bacterium]
MVKKILVPLDGSSLAEKALPFAKEEAKAHGA